MIKLLGIRKKYLNLYRSLLFSSLQEEERKLVNEKLALIEDILEPCQIAAFRLFLGHCYLAQRNQEEKVQFYDLDSEISLSSNVLLSRKKCNTDERRVEAQHIHCSNEKDLSDK